MEISSGKTWRRMVDQHGGRRQLYWGHMAALLLRLIYLIFPEAGWGFVFVDDFCWLLCRSLAEPLACTILLFLVAFGCPLSWKKAAMGSTKTWLGFEVTPRLQLVRMGSLQHEMVIMVLKRMIEDGAFAQSELDSGLGRVHWATSRCPLIKPFLPAVKHSGGPNKLRSPSFLCSRTSTASLHLALPEAPGGGLEMPVPRMIGFHGGWLSDRPDRQKSEVWWFHYQVLEEIHLDFQGQEAHATRCCFEDVWNPATYDPALQKNLPTQWTSCATPRQFNQGNVYGLLHEYTRKMPTAWLLMEIMFQLTWHSGILLPTHVKGEYNQ